MIKSLLTFAIMSIVAHKIYRYCKFMGYYETYLVNTDRNEAANFEPSRCDRRYEHLNTAAVGSTPLRDRRKILQIPNTLDSDLLPNGICMFSSGHVYPFVNFRRSSSPRTLLLYQDEQTSTTTTTTTAARSSIYMIDMNYLDQLKPVALDIVDAESMLPKPLDRFNLFAISIYQDEDANFKLLGANYLPQTRSIRIEKFSLDMNR